MVRNIESQNYLEYLIFDRPVRLVKRASLPFCLFIFMITQDLIAQTTIRGDLYAYISTIVDDMPRRNTNAYVQPTSTEIAKFNEIFSFIEASDFSVMQLRLNEFDYQFVRFIHEGTVNDTVFVMRERNPITRGWGAYIWRPAYEKNVHVQVPHPIFDNNTPYVGLRAFMDHKMRFYSIAGTHRYANGEPETNPPSDMARNSQSVFQLAHQRWSDAPALQVHGFNDSNSIYENYPDAILSNGTKNPQTLLYAVRDRLRNRNFTADVYDNNTSSQLGLLAATQNSQGQWSAQNNHTFIHVELASYMRTVTYQIGQVSLAFGESFPTVTSIDPHQADLQNPEDVVLHQNYPNPFNSGTIIRYRIDSPGEAVLQVFDITGRLVHRRTLMHAEAGEQFTHFNGAGLASGAYTYFLQFNNGYSSVRLQRSMILLK